MGSINNTPFNTRMKSSVIVSVLLFSLLISFSLAQKTPKTPAGDDSRSRPRDPNAPTVVEEPESEPEPDSEPESEPEPKSKLKSESEQGSGSINLQVGAGLILALLINTAAAF